MALAGVEISVVPIGILSRLLILAITYPISSYQPLAVDDLRNGTGNLIPAEDDVGRSH
jgi:hypothetical protein